MLSHDTNKVLSQYWADLGNPVSMALRDCFREGDWGRVQKILRSLCYDKKWIDPYRLRRARLALDIIKKADYLPIEINREEEALKSALSAEKLCRRTNHEMLLFELNHAKANPTLLRYLKKVRKIVWKIMGDIPDLSYVFGGFGPGATLSNTRENSSFIEKLTAKPTSTTDCVWFYPALPKRLRDAWGEVDNWSLQEASRFQTVPKSYKTERPICVEPLVNAWVQRYFGLVLKNRLKRSGIDIDNAKPLHMELARRGSLNGDLATLDMSMASDTISRDLVKYLIPPEWFRCLDACRTKYTDYGEYYYTYPDLFTEYGVHQMNFNNKFSSMGNGFTFELETIIFTAIGRVFDKKARSFGDDLIVSSRYSADVILLLEACGFIVNTEKSFSTGFFRESCGGDYYYGIPVKGETLKTQPSCVQEWYEFHNRLFRLSKQYNLYLVRTLNLIRVQVPKRFRLDIPEYFGDGGFFSDTPKGRLVDGIMRYKTYRRYFQNRQPWEHLYNSEVVLAGALLGASSVGPRKFGGWTSRVQWDPPRNVPRGFGQ